MGQPTNHTLAQEFAAALEWWREAGVDTDFSDDVTDWLAAPAAESEVEPAQPVRKRTAQQVSAPPEAKKIGGNTADWPAELAAFQTWLISDPALDDGGASPPVPPRGSAGASLMIIVSEPEETDRDSLLSGAQGRLLSGMLKAAGIAEDQAYLASVLRRHTPMPDWAALQAGGIGDLLAHHIALAAPKRILAFGRNIPPLFGNDTAQGAAILHNFNHEGGSIPAMGAGSLSELLRSASQRQRFWQRWLEWTDG